MYAAMTTGNWTIILQATDYDFAVERVFYLTVGAANVITVTVSLSRNLETIRCVRYTNKPRLPPRLLWELLAHLQP
jgi:hypothetical protein